MAFSTGLLAVRNFWYKECSYFVTNFDHDCGRLYGLTLCKWMDTSFWFDTIKFGCSAVYT